MESYTTKVRIVETTVKKPFVNFHFMVYCYGDDIFSRMAEMAETAESSFTDYGQP